MLDNLYLCIHFIFQLLPKYLLRLPDPQIDHRGALWGHARLWRNVYIYNEVYEGLFLNVVRRKKMQTRLQDFIWFVLTFHQRREKNKKIMNIFSSAKSKQSEGQFAFSSHESCLSNNSSNTFFTLLSQETSTGSNTKCAIRSSETKCNLVFTFWYTETEKLFIIDGEAKT